MTNGQVTAAVARSAGGFAARPADGPGQPLGLGGEPLFSWFEDGDTAGRFYPWVKTSTAAAAAFGGLVALVLRRLSPARERASAIASSSARICWQVASSVSRPSELAGPAMTDDGAAFGTRLAACRQSAGLSQKELAERSGLSIREISNLERGRSRSPHPDSTRRLADALGLRGQARADFLAAAGRRLARDVTARAVTTPQGQPGRADGAQTVPRQLPQQCRISPAGCTG